MIEWMRRVDPTRRFLTAGEQTWSFGEALAEIERRLADKPRVAQPSLTPESVFDVLAGLLGRGVTVVGPEPETTIPGDADLVVYTSGTSGEPKGVRLTRSNLESAARASAEHLGHDAEDNWLLAMPLHHVGGLAILVRQMYTGGSITMLQSFEPVDFAEAMRREATMVSLVPTMLRRLFALGPFHGLKAVLVGGGPIPEGLLEEASSLGLPVLPTYGMTETFGQVATLRPGSKLEYKAHPLPDVDFRVAPDGRIGVRGPMVSAGYVGEPDREEDWFTTGDLGSIDADGAIRVMGRADAVIVTGGENVDPERVEAVLLANEDVAEVVVAGVPDDEWGTRLVCIYAGDVEARELQDWAGERLPGFAVPKEWIEVPSVPRTGIGKPDRRAAAELAARRQG